MSVSFSGELDLSPLFSASSAIISRLIEPDLIAQYIERGDDVFCEDECDGVVATIKLEDIELSNHTMAVVLKATGFRTYSLIRSNNSDDVYLNIILLRK